MKTKFIQVLLLSLLVSMTSFLAHSRPPAPAGGGCCYSMGGPSYCDSSAGRLVCKNGFYSTCYCTRHAVMDLQFLRGCCLWKGGVMQEYNATGLILCRDGSVSEECSIQNPAESIAAW